MLFSVLMKYLLVIPVLALFLSNIPIKMEMPMPVAKKKPGCCMMKHKEKMSCRADKAPADKTGCCNTGSMCTYSCCLQVLAPAQPFAKFNFRLPVEKILNGFYLQANWTNPFIDGPLQPPDTV